MRYVFVYNPAAGKPGAYKKVLEEARAAVNQRGLPYEEFMAERPGHAAEITRAVVNGKEPARLYGLGGDGTLCEIANGAAGAENVQVGIFPLGSGNDYIRTYGGKEPFLDVAAQLSAPERRVDMIKTDKMLALNLCSMGLDAAVAMNMTRFKKLPLISGSMAYDIALAKCVLSRLGNELSVTIDGEERIDGKFLFALAGSGQYYGGGYKGAPGAVPDDGLLDFVLIRKMSRLRLAGLLADYKAGNHLESPKFKDILIYRRGKKMEITSQSPAVVNYDGECELIHRVTFEIVPKALRFLVPEMKR